MQNDFKVFQHPIKQLDYYICYTTYGLNLFKSNITLHKIIFIKPK